MPTANGTASAASINGDAARLAAILHARKEGEGWWAFCPGHNDQNTPNLHLTQKHDRIDVWCFVCQDNERVLDSLEERGIPRSQLFVSAGGLSGNGNAGAGNRNGHHHNSWMCPDHNCSYKPVLHYAYGDGLRKVRLNCPTTGCERKTFYWQRRDSDTALWVPARGVKPQILYRQSEISKAILAGVRAARDDFKLTVFICEGEKDVDTLVNGLVLVATSAPSSSWPDSYTERIRSWVRNAVGAVEFVVLADQDPRGHQYANEVARSLHRAGLRIKLLHLPGLVYRNSGDPPNGLNDVTDWVERLGGTETWLMRLVDDAPLWQPAEESDNSPFPFCDDDEIDRPILKRLSDVQPREIDWLWPPYILRGAMTILDGDPSVGKTMFLLYLATVLSRGWPLLDQQGEPSLSFDRPHNTLYIGVEDGLADTIRPRFDRMGGDPSRIYFLKGKTTKEGDAVFTLLDTIVLEQAIVQAQASLIVIDPIYAYLGSASDINQVTGVKPLLDSVRDVAERHACAIVAVRHFTKGGYTRSIYRGIGSIAFIGSARSALQIERLQGSTGERSILMHAKSNNSALGTSLVFDKTGGDFTWCGTSPITADEFAASSAGGSRGPSPHALHEAMTWLGEVLQYGPRLSADLSDEAKQNGITEATLQRAKKAMRVRSTKQGNSWYWRLGS